MVKAELTEPTWRKIPFEHQIEMAKFHSTYKNTIDTSDVGTGKTLPMIVTLQGLINSGRAKKILVMAPNSILENWEHELTDCSALKFVTLRGTRDKRTALLQQNHLADVYLINYEGVRTVIDQLLAANFDTIVADEVHHLKGWSSQQSKCALKLAKSANCRKGMTGTILTNNLMDLWSIAQFIDSAIFATNFWGYRNRYMMDVNAGKPWMKWPDWQPRPGAVAEVQRRLEPYCIRFEKREVLKFLPPVLYETRMIELQGEQARVYKELKRDFVADLDNSAEPLAALQILPRITKLLEVASGFVYRDEGTYRFKENAKLAELRAVLEELGDKQALIWCAFREDTTIVAKMCIPLWGGSGGGCEIIDGNTVAEDRQRAVDLFNEGRIQYLIANPACAGEGLTILAPYAIYYSRSWKLGERIQSLGRFDRPGAEKHDNLTVIDIVAKDTVDCEVLAALGAKQDLLKAINAKAVRGWLR